MSRCISEELTVEKDSKNRPDAYFFWLPPACPWHVFLPAEAAGFPETGWSCWLLGLVPFCGDWSSEGALYSCQTLPCVFGLSVITTAFQIAPNQPALSGLLLGTKGCWWNQRNAVAGLTGTLPPPQGHRSVP